MNEDLNSLEESVRSFRPEAYPSGLLSDNQKPSLDKIKKCPKCGSVFCTEDFCESCGFQFRTEELGAPFGPKSFYELHDSFWSHDSLEILSPELSLSIRNKEVFKIYKRALVKRYNLLLKHFSVLKESGLPLKEDPYWVELRDILTEIAFIGLKDQEIWKHASNNSYSTQLIYDLQQILSEERAEVTKHKTKKASRLFFSLRLFAYVLCFVFFAYVLSYI